MALGDYTPTAWVNGTTPAINATNLGHIETKIDEIDAATTATTGSIIWSTSNSGNDIRPPAPKPNSVGSSTIGFVDVPMGAAGAIYTLPAGGTWLYSLTQWIQASGIINTTANGIASGGTSVGASVAGALWRGFAWRIT